MKVEEERFKVLSAIYYLIMEIKARAPLFQSKVSKLLQIDEEDLSLDLKYLHEKGYINIGQGVNNSLIRGITSPGIDFIENPFKAEGVPIIGTNVNNTTNINMNNTHIEGKTINIIQQNITKIFNTNISIIGEQIKNLESLVKNIDSPNSSELKKLLGEADVQLKKGDRTGFIVAIKNFFGRTFEELKPKSFNSWLELILTTMRIAKLLTYS